MSKVLKVVSVVATIGAAIATAGVSLGVSAAVLSAVGVGASVGRSLLAKRSKVPQNSPENVNRLRANLDPRTPRKTVIGVTAMATDIRDEEFTGDQEYFHRFIVCASHAVESIDEVWFDDELAWSDTGGVAAKFAGYLTVAKRIEGTAVNAINISARMGTARRYTGLAYVHLRYKLTGNDKKTDSPFAQSITTRITIRGKGAALYDPRLDSTVAGGTGTQRADDQTTWAWSDDACRNPALALLFYLLGYQISGKLAVGKGIPANRIDLESFAIAANLCDELVAKEVAGTEPRYRVDGVWSESDSPTSVMDMLKASMNGDLDDMDGKLRLTILHNDLALPVADFTDGDVIGEFQWDAGASLDTSFNIVRGAYTDPSDTALYQLVDYPEVTDESPDGIDRIETLNLPMVQSPDQAQRLAALRLARQKFGGTFSADFQATAWAVQKNSVIRLSFSPRGFVNKLFRVAEIDLRDDGRVPLVLREEDAAVYTPPTLRPPVQPVPSTPYDPSLSPLIAALNEADQIKIAISSQSDVAITATDDEIVIGDHTRFYSDRMVAVLGSTLTTDADANVITPETDYYLYYDDPARAGGNVLWFASLVFDEAQNNSDNPARHYGGYITTDEVGGTGTTGGGSLPPGSGGTDPYCVSDDTPIRMADGSDKAARDMRVGDELQTYHERTMQLGTFTVEAVEFAEEPVFVCWFGSKVVRATANHRFYIEGQWVKAKRIGWADGTARVAKITVADAHTYISNGILSHNIKANTGGPGA